MKSFGNRIAPMNNRLSEYWQHNLDLLDFAFQPICDIHTGRTFGVEALLRNFKEAGYASIFALFDAVYNDGCIYSFDLHLRELALKKFIQIPFHKELKLFYNLDNRIFEMDNFSNGNTDALLKKYSLNSDNICFEISERHEISHDCDIGSIMRHYKESNFCIAIDDFGVGYSGYKLLYDSTPNIIKIDRYFLNNLHNDPKKQTMVKSITHLATQLGIKIVAEGVETTEELLACETIGCQYVQGYLVQEPTKLITDIFMTSERIKKMIQSLHREDPFKIDLKKHIEIIEPLYVKTKMAEVVEKLKKRPDTSIFPIINSANEPLGILKERQIKDYLYSPYGMSILLNEKGNSSKLKSLLSSCAICDIHSNITMIIELFSLNPEASGIIITKNSKYYGFLSAKAIIHLMHEHNIILAQEQNPLTKLPGNTLIESYIYSALTSDKEHTFCYFDLDNFKAYNDCYGFRSGDRVILLFAQILQKSLSKEFFIGHIGGDDFFIASCQNHIHTIHKIEQIIKKFKEDVLSFYSAEDRHNGYIDACDRENNPKRFKLLSVSASILVIAGYSRYKEFNQIQNILAKLKKCAKNEPRHMALAHLL